MTKPKKVKKSKAKKRKPTERELVKMGLANNATAEIMEKYMKNPGERELDKPMAVHGNGLKIFS